MVMLEKEDTPILSGMQIYYNYIRPHQALKTLAEVAGIQVRGKDKWKTLIQNATRSV